MTTFYDIILPDERLFDISVSSIALLLWYYYLRRTTDKTEKRLSWILTLLSSSVSSFGCIPVVYEGFKTGFPSELIYGNDRISRALVNFFCSYLLWDTILIYTDYPSIGGIHHHLPYLLFMVVSLHYKCPAMFAVFMPMEISSIFLSIGHIWPSYRADFLFGITFFAGRIVYHFILWCRLYVTREESPFFVWPFALLPFFVHLQWFYKWCLSMLRKRRKQ